MEGVLQRIARFFQVSSAAPLPQAALPDESENSMRSPARAITEALGEVHPEALVAGPFVPPH